LGKVRISVLLPVHNKERYLEASIRSILLQTFEDFELIIIDDASTDKTAEILRGYEDRRIRVIHNQSNLGLAECLNRGIKLARGAFIARQDADDISMPERCGKQIKVLEENKSLCLVGSSFDIINERGESVVVHVKVPQSDFRIREVLHDANPFCHGSTMLRKEHIEAVGGYRGFFKYAQDYDLWLRLSEHYELRNIGDVLYLWRRESQPDSYDRFTEQIRYAMVALAQARKRKKGESDDIERGFSPPLPALRQISRGLRRQLWNYHRAGLRDAFSKWQMRKAVWHATRCVKMGLSFIPFTEKSE